jgi:hypothetical protein
LLITQVVALQGFDQPVFGDFAAFTARVLATKSE